MMTPPPFVAALGTAIALTITAPAIAQTPGRLSDMVGARAGQAEGELQRRGYQATERSEAMGDGRLTYWRRGDECVAILTRDGRYASINQAGPSECGSSDTSSGQAQAFSPPEFGYGASYDRDGYREHFALLCYGEAQRLESQQRTGYEWDGEKNRYVPREGFDWSRQAHDSSVTIEIDGTRGRIRPAENMVPPLHGSNDDGWYELSNLSVSRDTIQARFRFNGLNRPDITIDRRVGHIQITGQTPFSGTCQPLDSDRRF